MNKRVWAVLLVCLLTRTLNTGINFANLTTGTVLCPNVLVQSQHQQEHLFGSKKTVVPDRLCYVKKFVAIDSACTKCCTLPVHWLRWNVRRCGCLQRQEWPRRPSLKWPRCFLDSRTVALHVVRYCKQWRNEWHLSKWKHPLTRTNRKRKGKRKRKRTGKRGKEPLQSSASVGFSMCTRYLYHPGAGYCKLVLYGMSKNIHDHFACTCTPVPVREKFIFLLCTRYCTVPGTKRAHIHTYIHMKLHMYILIVTHVNFQYTYL